MGIFTAPPRTTQTALSNLIYLDNIHANSVIFEGIAFLIKGASGAGKSDLSLRMIDQGGTLIGDDRTLIYTDHKNIYLTPHDNIAGKIEVRGIGIINVPFYNIAKCDVILELATEYPRYPFEKSCIFYKNMLNYYQLNPFETSILEKLKVIAHHIKNHPKGLA